MENTELHTRLQQKLKTYKPSAETIALVQGTPKLFFVGISGAGKDTVVHELLKDGGYHLIVSHTTRPPRANNGIMEQDGREYHFITLEQAEEMVDTGAYIEAKLYGSNVYGTSAAELKAAHDSGQVAITDIEVQGVAEYMEMDPHTKVIFLLPPSYEVWQDRFHRRYGDAPDKAAVVERMQAALRELEHALSVSYYYFLVNDSLDAAVAEAKAVAAGREAPQQATHAHQVAQELAARLREELSKQGA